MSAKQDHDMPFGFVDRILHPVRDKDIIAELTQEFDRSVDGRKFDPEKVEQRLKESQQITKLFKRISIVRTLMFPLEYVLLRVFLGKENAQNRFLLQRAIWAFLRGRISKHQLTVAISQFGIV